MTRQEAEKQLKRLKGIFDKPFGLFDKRIIEQLYMAVLGRVFVPTTCQNCYHDAVIEMICYLKHNDMADIKNYILKAGAIIDCADFDGGKIYSNANLTDDVARRYLEKYPQRVVLFAKVPEKAAETEISEKVEQLPTDAGKVAQNGQKRPKNKRNRK